jgi:hypothetical protein
MALIIREVNNLILSTAPTHIVKSVAPSTIPELFSQPTLVIWSGASDHTIFGDPSVNWAFRALHDALHLKTRIGFSPESEIELGRIQANQYTGLMADIVYIEVAGQAAHFLKTGQFVENQVEFTIKSLQALGYKF